MDNKLNLDELEAKAKAMAAVGKPSTIDPRKELISLSTETLARIADTFDYIEGMPDGETVLTLIATIRDRDAALAVAREALEQIRGAYPGIGFAGDVSKAALEKIAGKA